MSKTRIHRVGAHFGDGDPAGTAYFPGFSRCVEEPLARTYTRRRRVRHGDDRPCEGTMGLDFVIENPASPGRIEATPIPDDIKAPCR